MKKELTQTTKSISAKQLERKWHLIDVGGKILGRVAPEIAKFLQGKHKRSYVSYLDSGDYVVVINAKLIKVTGNKAQTKTYGRFSGYPGGLKITSFEKMLERKPGEIIRRAVSGMLPKNTLRDRRLARLFVFADDKHTYEDQFNVKS